MCATSGPQSSTTRGTTAYRIGGFRQVLVLLLSEAARIHPELSDPRPECLRIDIEPDGRPLGAFDSPPRQLERMRNMRGHCGIERGQRASERAGTVSRRDAKPSPFARALGEYGSVVFISGNMPMKTEITTLLIVTKLEQYDYAGATAIATVMLVASFVLLLVINLAQAWTRSRTRAAS